MQRFIFEAKMHKNHIFLCGKIFSKKKLKIFKISVDKADKKSYYIQALRK